MYWVESIHKPAFPAALRPKIFPGAGWNATTGWDPVTGMGTPNIAKLLGLAMAGNGTVAPTNSSTKA